MNKGLGKLILGVCLGSAALPTGAGILDGLGAALKGANTIISGGKQDEGVPALFEGMAAMKRRSAAIGPISVTHLTALSERGPIDKSLHAPRLLGTSLKLDPYLCAASRNSLFDEAQKSKGSLELDIFTKTINSCMFVETKQQLREVADQILMLHAANRIRDQGTERYYQLLILLARAYFALANYEQSIELTKAVLQGERADQRGLVLKFAESLAGKKLVGETGSERMSAAALQVAVYIEQGRLQVAETVLEEFFRDNAKLFDGTDYRYAIGLGEIGEAYERLGYRARAEYLFKNTYSHLNNFMSLAGKNPMVAASFGIAATMCDLAALGYQDLGFHMTGGYVCDGKNFGPYYQAMLNYAGILLRSGRTQDLADFYSYTFVPALSFAKNPALTLSVTPVDLDVHFKMAEMLEMSGNHGLALSAYERVATGVQELYGWMGVGAFTFKSISPRHLEYAGYLARFLSLASIQGDQRTKTVALNSWLRFKGTLASLHRHTYQELNSLSNLKYRRAISDAEKKLSAMQASLADTARTNANWDSVAPLIEAANDFNESVKDLEEKISLSFAASVSNIDHQSLSNKLGRDQVFLDFLRTTGDKGKPIYVVTLLRKDEMPKFIQIPAPPIESNISSLQKYIRDSIDSAVIPEKVRIDGYTKTLYLTLVKHLLPDLAGISTLYLSPDGAITAIPFEILASDDGAKYPLATKNIVYVAAPADFFILRDGQTRDGFVAVANPQYAGNLKAKPGAARLARDGSEFPPLPETEAEARSLDALARSSGQPTQMLLGVQADKAAVVDLRAPRVLHVATHGFYLSNNSNFDMSTRQIEATADNRNPLWRSGVALAGANLKGQTGVLYAAEVTKLNLGGTDLVTLSACDTGSGDITLSEGVVGLTRSFLVAGAGAVISSKWPVSSEETVDFMKMFYEPYFAGEVPAKAMTLARVKMMERNSNPYFWGAFSINQAPSDRLGR